MASIVVAVVQKNLLARVNVARRKERDVRKPGIRVLHENRARLDVWLARVVDEARHVAETLGVYGEELFPVFGVSELRINLVPAARKVGVRIERASQDACARVAPRGCRRRRVRPRPDRERSLRDL